MTTPESIAAELATLETGAAVYPLTDRASLRITGSDATRWLNGMVTNNIKDLAPGEGNYNFLLNAQGRIQGDATIYREPADGQPTFLLETDSSQFEAVKQHLDHFIIMDDVELADLDFYRQVVLLFGAKAAELLRSVENPSLDYEVSHANLPPNRIADYPLTASLILTKMIGQFQAFEFPTTIIPKLFETLRAAGAKEISPEALEAHRILSGIPRFGVDIRDKDLPQETNQPHALHFSKGCYLGQEIVERIHSRGQVHRLFTRFQLHGELPQLPAPLEANGKPAGELTSAAAIGTEIFALGYARREALDLKQQLTYQGGTAEPRTASQK